MTSAGTVDRFRILCVCTGNVFRSRVAEHLLRAGLDDRLGTDAAAFEVASAGTRVAPGRPVQPAEAAALGRYGMPADDRPSRLLAPSDVVRADLILCADRSHRSVVLGLSPGALRRTFMIQEFARVAGSVPRSDPSGGSVVRARRVVAATAAHRTSVPPDASDEITDPWGRPDDVLGSAVDLVRHAVPRVLDALLGEARTEDGLDHHE